MFLSHLSGLHDIACSKHIEASAKFLLAPSHEQKAVPWGVTRVVKAFGNSGMNVYFPTPAKINMHQKKPQWHLHRSPVATVIYLLLYRAWFSIGFQQFFPGGWRQWCGP